MSPNPSHTVCESWDQKLLRSRVASSSPLPALTCPNLTSRLPLYVPLPPPAPAGVALADCEAAAPPAQQAAASPPARADSDWPRTPVPRERRGCEVDLSPWAAPLRTTLEVVLASRGCREAAAWRRANREAVRAAERRFVDPNATQS